MMKVPHGTQNPQPTFLLRFCGCTSPTVSQNNVGNTSIYSVLHMMDAMMDGA